MRSTTTASPRKSRRSSRILFKLRETSERRRRSFDNVQVMYEAAANGLGIALAADELAGTHLASGRLVKPFSDEPVALRQSYYLVYRKERVQPALRALRAALLGRMR